MKTEIIKNSFGTYQMVSWTTKAPEVDLSGYSYTKEDLECEPEKVVETLIKQRRWELAEKLMDQYI